MELVLATLAIPPKADPKDKVQVPPTAADTKPPRDAKEKLCNKDEKVVVFYFIYFCYLATFVRGLNLMEVEDFLLMILVFMLPLL